MKRRCKECGRFSLSLNNEEECPECVKKDEELKSCFIAPSCAKPVPSH